MHILLLAEKYCLCDGMLYYISSSDNALLAVPKSLREEFMQSAHAAVFAGHFSFLKTYRQLKTKYFWPNMYTDVKKHCQSCFGCQQRKPKRPTTRIPLKSITSDSPWQIVAMDAIGPISPKSAAGHAYILTMTDFFTRYIEAVPLRNITAESCARKFVKYIVLRHGCPQRLLSDKAQNFNADLMQEICKLLQIKKISTTAFHPAGDGLCESVNKHLINMLSIYIDNNRDTWHTFLPYCVHAYRTTYQQSIQESPFFLNHGRDCRQPSDVAFTPPSHYIIDLSDFKTELRIFLYNAWQLAQANLLKAQEKQQKYYNKRVTQHRVFKDGDLVWLHNPVVPLGVSPKLHKPWTGPYRITSVLAQNALIVPMNKPDKKPERVHQNRLKPFWGAVSQEQEQSSKNSTLKNERSQASLAKTNLASNVATQDKPQNRYFLRPRSVLPKY